MKLVTSTTNWADEMDLWGFEVVSDAFYQIALQVLDYAFNEEGITLAICVGTNEEVEFTSYSSIESAFAAKDINEDEVKIVKHLFHRTFGGFDLFATVVDKAMSEIRDKEKRKEFLLKFTEAYNETKAKK